ncbi:MULTISPECIES: alpha/beta fold hydrolase [Streptomyces]|uniref:Esterase/lipase n=2 Tax=Streptomyces TaxID=1883 RepID=A0A380P601_STRGR|nr:alpha/beta hydrolase [Streptomyces griseus]NEE46682.1 alpha/beta hydrolase [Streptomyces sp. SID8455]SUP60641.1 Esterase/lipase [Streptomyces griseus]
MPSRSAEGTGAPGEPVARLARAALSLRPLLEVLPAPVAVSRDARAGASAELVERITRRLALPALDLRGTVPGQEPGTFPRIIGERLGLTGPAHGEPCAELDDPAVVDRIVDVAAAGDFDRFATRSTVETPDGTPLRVHTAGRPGSPAVVLASAPGMPARLAEWWIRTLAPTHHVVTWESRGLSGPPEASAATAYGLAEQSTDLVTAMDSAGMARAHVMGLCGGAVLAVVAAALHPERVVSLSLWHGDFELGPESPKTEHQRNLQALMAMVTDGRAPAGAIHGTLCRAISGGVPADLAHLVLHPYATVELFSRYCALNGAVMGTDLRPHLSSVTAPVLVVTSEDDSTAHPEGSLLVARRLDRADTWIRPHGDHVSLFRGAPGLLDRMAAFLDRHPAPA